MTTALLFAPPNYWRLTDIARGRICNGCGSKGLCGYVIPDTIWGLRITEACDIHDYQYETGRDHSDKESADRSFLYNLLRLIDAAGGPAILQWLRRRRAQKYYWAVCAFGGPAFWAGKNRPEEMRAAG